MAEKGIPLGTIGTGEYSISFYDTYRDDGLKDYEGTTVHPSYENSSTDDSPPLISAIRGGSTETYRFLQENKPADISLRETDSHNKNCFHNAITKPDLLKTLLEQFKTNLTHHLVLKQEDKDGETAMHCAARLGNVKSLEILHKHDNALMKQRSKITKRCVLHFAVISCSIVTVQFVLNKDPEQMNIADSMSRTPAHFAATVKQNDVIAFLISKGADLMRKDANGQLPIHKAARKGVLNIMELLIKYNSGCIDCLDNTRQTPLMLAAKNGFSQVVTYLLSKGAKYKLKDNNRCSAFDLAVMYERREVVEVFLNKDYWKEIIQKSKLGPEKCLAVLVETMPATSVQLLDKCIQVYGSIKRPESHKVQYDFFCLESRGEGCCTFEALLFMIENRSEECLSHPLCATFVNVKWRKRGFKYNVAALLLAVVFHVCLMIFASQGVVRSAGYDETRNSSKLTRTIRASVRMSPDSGWMMVLRGIMLIISFPMMLKELYQMKMQRSKYFLQPKHHVCWALNITVLIFLFPVNGRMTGIQHGSGIIAIFVSWLTLLESLRIIPVLGVYILVIRKVFWTVMKIFVVVFVFLLSFVSTFYITLAEFEGYDDYGIAIISTFMAMMSGPNYEEHFVAKSELHPELYGLNLIVLVIFMIVMSIVVNNTLIGLAVGDTDEVMKSAKLEKFLDKVLFTIHLEKTLNRFPWFYMDKEEYFTEYPGLKREGGEMVLDTMYSPGSIEDMEGGMDHKNDEEKLEQELEYNFENVLTAKMESLHSTLRMELMQIFEKMKENNDKDMAKREVMEQKIDKIFENLKRKW